jgi:hypothetical protein
MVNKFHSFILSQTVLEPTQPVIQWISAALSPRIDRDVKLTIHLHSEVKKMWTHTSTLSYVFMA